MTEKLILHEYAASGNCYKVRLTAACVGEHLERREYDIMKGETRTPQFLWEINSNGRIPVLQVDHRFIPESNAACFFLADGSPLIPSDQFDRADMQRLARPEPAFPNRCAIDESPVRRAQVTNEN